MALTTADRARVRADLHRRDLDQKMTAALRAARLRARLAGCPAWEKHTTADGWCSCCPKPVNPMLHLMSVALLA